MRRSIWVGLILVTAGVLRFLFLSDKPPHFDEGINGWFVDQIYKHGYFPYDPNNYHGPLHFYLLQISELIFGRSIFALRFVTSLFSMMIVGLTLAHERFFGKAARWAGLAFALSPAFVFYGRYAIHESELAFFLLLSAFGLLVAHKESLRRGILLFFIGLAGMLLTKETWFIHVGTGAIAWGILKVSEKYFPTDEPPSFKKIFSEKKWVGELTVGLVVVLYLFYSGFFYNPQGMLDFFAAYLPWFKTGVGGNGHDKPFYYWGRLLITYEPIFVVGFFGSLFFLKKGSWWLRFYWLNGIGTFLAYSIVPYKTPWCIVSILWPFGFLVGEFVENLRKNLWIYRGVTAVLCAILFGTLARTIDLSFLRYDNPKEPYIYVSSMRGLNDFMDILKTGAKKNPALMSSNIQVCLNSYWPLPWLLGQWTDVAYSGTNCKLEKHPLVLLVDQSRQQLVAGGLEGSYFLKSFQLRDAQEPFVAYFSEQEFGQQLKDRPEFALQDFKKVNP